MNASHGSWVKGLVGHMGHESLSLTHLQLCLQVCQIRRNRIGQNNGLVNLHWLDYCFVLFYFTLLLIYGCRVVYYVCMSPLMCLYSCIIDSQKGAIGKFSLCYLLGVQQNLIFSESTPLGQAEPSVVMAALWIASASMFSKITDCTFGRGLSVIVTMTWGAALGCSDHLADEMSLDRI